VTNKFSTKLVLHVDNLIIANIVAGGYLFDDIGNKKKKVNTQ